MESNVSQKGNFFQRFSKFRFFISWEEISTFWAEWVFAGKECDFFGDRKKETLLKYRLFISYFTHCCDINYLRTDKTHFIEGSQKK